MFPHGILYHPGQIQVLERCSKSKAPFLFLPVHKSPLDSIVIKSVLEKTPSRHDLKTFLASRPKEIQLKPSFQILDDSIEDIAWSVKQATISSIFVNHGNILTFLESEVCKEGRPNLALDGTVLGKFPCQFVKVVLSFSFHLQKSLKRYQKNSADTPKRANR